MKFLFILSKWIVGALFIFSGLIKLNDPIGTSIKLEEYFEVFSMDIWSFFHVFSVISLPLALFLCVLEVVLGISLLMNYRFRLTVWLLLWTIVFFTFLTFYSAYFNKVTDCGCFGDALKLTPWQSFSKDIFLLCLIVILFSKRNSYFSSTPNLTKNIIIVASVILVTFIGYYAIEHLPYIDFRAYKIGSNIPKSMKPSGVLRYTYIMEKDGKKYSFESYPLDTSYRFKNMKVINPEVAPKITDYDIWNEEQNFTEESFRGKKLLIIIRDPKQASVKNISRINTLIQELEKDTDIQIWAITSVDKNTFEEFRHKVQLAIPYFFADGTVLKTMMRANPGIILLQGGTVTGMWHHNDTPKKQEVIPLLR